MKHGSEMSRCPYGTAISNSFSGIENENAISKLSVGETHCGLLGMLFAPSVPRDEGFFIATFNNQAIHIESLQQNPLFN